MPEGPRDGLPALPAGPGGGGIMNPKVATLRQQLDAASVREDSDRDIWIFVLTSGGREIEVQISKEALDDTEEQHLDRMVVEVWREVANGLDDPDFAGVRLNTGRGDGELWFIRKRKHFDLGYP